MKNEHTTLLEAVRPRCELRRCSGRLQLDGLHERLHQATWSDPKPTKRHYWAIWSCPTCKEQYYHCDGVFCVGAAYMDLRAGVQL